MAKVNNTDNQEDNTVASEQPNTNNAVVTPEPAKMVKYQGIGSVSHTIEVDGKDVRIYNGAIIELPENCKQARQLLRLNEIEVYTEPEAKTRKQN